MQPNPRFLADLVTFTEKILNGKPYFLCGGNCILQVFSPITTNTVLYKMKKSKNSKNWSLLGLALKLFFYPKICGYKFSSPAIKNYFFQRIIAALDISKNFWIWHEDEEVNWNLIDLITIVLVPHLSVLDNACETIFRISMSC